MYRGGKEHPPSSSASIIKRVFQVSWFPTLKPKASKTRHSPTLPTTVEREARIYSMGNADDDGAHWRLSFRSEDRKSITAIPVRSRETKPKQYRDRIVYNQGRRLTRKKQLGRGTEDDEKPKPVMEKYTFSRNFSLLSSVDEEDYARVSNSELVCMTSRKLRHRRIKSKTTSKTKDQVADGTTVYDRFAEAKTSFDPQQDFKDSMIQMICEKGIRRPVELEDLLACYLMLNRDEYHDLIIRGFQQVWFQLRGS